MTKLAAAIAVLALLCPASAQSPVVETTPKNGLCLSAQGPIVIAKVDEDGKMVDGSMQEIVPKKDLDAANAKIDALTDDVKELQETIAKQISNHTANVQAMSDLQKTVKEQGITLANCTTKEQVNVLVRAALANSDDPYLKESDVAADIKDAQDYSDNLFLNKTDAKAEFASADTVDDLVELTNGIQKAVVGNAKNLDEALFKLKLTAELTAGGLKLCPKVEPSDSNVLTRHNAIENVPGATVDFQCKAGTGKPQLKPKGLTKVTCLVSGKWTKEAPTCGACPPETTTVDTSRNQWRMGGGASVGQDFRSGGTNALGTATSNLVAAPGPKEISFSFQWVVGYCGNDCSKRKGAELSLMLIDEKGTSEIVWGVKDLVSKPNGDHSYDACRNHGGWGQPDDPNDGCYSDHTPVTIGADKLSKFAQSKQLRFRWLLQARDVNVHMQYEQLNLKVTHDCLG
jgi:hypothetical protein